jgi:hypothetical protein
MAESLKRIRANENDPQTKKNMKLLFDAESSEESSEEEIESDLESLSGKEQKGEGTSFDSGGLSGSIDRASRTVLSGLSPSKIFQSRQDKYSNQAASAANSPTSSAD